MLLCSLYTSYDNAKWGTAAVVMASSFLPDLLPALVVTDKTSAEIRDKI